jgi:hypothetical protein
VRGIPNRSARRLRFSSSAAKNASTLGASVAAGAGGDAEVVAGAREDVALAGDAGLGTSTACFGAADGAGAGAAAGVVSGIAALKVSIDSSGIYASVSLVCPSRILPLEELNRLNRRQRDLKHRFPSGEL